MQFKTLKELKKMKVSLQGEDADFWYDLTDGGYIDPNILLNDPSDAIKVLAAIKVVQDFQELFLKASEELNEEDES